MAKTRAHDEAWETFRSMYTRLDGELARRSQRDHGLSAADQAVLCTLRSARGGTMRALDLRHALGWEKSRLAHQMRRMEERALVVRGECEDDGRAPLVHLTPRGRAVIAAASPAYGRDLQELFFDALDADQLAALTAISETVLAHLEQRRTSVA